MPIQTDYQTSPGPAEMPMAEVVQISDLPNGPRALELRVSIEDREHRVRLAIDELTSHGLSGQAAADALPQAVEALVGIEARLEQILNAIPNYEDVNGYIDRLAERLSQSR